MISILTTVYNGYEFLEECARSIYLQQRSNGGVQVDWEWWIGVNGHGADGGKALIAAQAVRGLAPTGCSVHVVNLPDVKGRVGALNALAGQATGDWVAVLDCDDVWEPEKLLVQMTAIQMSSRRIDVIGTFCSYFGEVVSDGPSLPSGWITRERVLMDNPIINSSVLVRRELAAWEDRFGLEDYDLWIRLGLAGRGIFNVPHRLVRHRIHGASAFNGKGGQDLAGLHAFHDGVTVVSAYYPIPSKHEVSTYVDWIKGFWLTTKCNLVFYTDSGLVHLFEDMFSVREGATRVVGLDFQSLSAFTEISPNAWVETARLDTEHGHSPELYALWYEKKEFVRRAIEMNPFKSCKFVWCDAGIGRYPEWNNALGGFPRREMIPRGRMLVLEIDPFLPEDYVADTDGIMGVGCAKRATIGGGILASDIDGWREWSRAYDAMLMRYHLAGHFIGKDQNIMASMILERPELAIPVRRFTELGPIQGWFSLLFVLAGVRIDS